MVNKIDLIVSPHSPVPSLGQGGVDDLAKGHGQVVRRLGLGTNRIDILFPWVNPGSSVRVMTA